MYELKDSGILTEIISGNNFEYILQDSSHFVNTDYKVLQSQINSVFVPCMKMKKNGKLDLYYITDEYRPMSALFDGITEENFISIVNNLFADILEVQNNGFLTCQCIDLSWDKIFVEQNTLKVKLVYLPVSVRVFDSYAEFENELRSSIVKLINRLFVNYSQRMAVVVAELCDGSLSLESVYNNLRDGSTLPGLRNQAVGNTSRQESVISHNIGNQNTDNNTIKMVAMNAPGYFEIVIDREETIIGKKPELVDEIIPYNKTISRKHCIITKRNNEFYILDVGSANGTYVNGVRLSKGQSCPVKPGDVVHLADSSFQIM